MTMMRHGDDEATVEYDADAQLFHGEVVNLRSVVTFQGRSVEELQTAFADSIDDYVDFCRQLGKEPEQPYSGQMLVKVEPGLHRAVVSAARRSGVTPDEWVARALERATV